MKKLNKTNNINILVKPLVKKSYKDSIIGFLKSDSLIRNQNTISVMFLLLGIIGLIIQNRFFNSFLVGGFTGTYIAIVFFSIMEYNKNG